jgi:hypothetical protein
MPIRQDELITAASAYDHAERCGNCAVEVGQGARLTTGRASPLQRTKCQSLYFGPPW